ncbi:hypothetical protein [Rhizomicrobium electricum]|uniref:hypothetical protein n=1 Tax=Rhizomicrobium electricum TaxID=480070 RepID=UPI0014229669|nr:hypothetical protein [Rhizomicrobium electricum]NIJ47788.1 hypothetical protein [Rhizomicrobium electricum]
MPLRLQRKQFQSHGQRAGFRDVSPDIGIQSAALAGEFAVLVGVAIAERCAAASGWATSAQSGRDEDTLSHRPSFSKTEEREFNSAILASSHCRR